MKILSRQSFLRRPRRCFEQLEERRLLAFVPFVGEVKPGLPVAFLSNGGNGCCVSDIVANFLAESGAVVKITHWNDILNEDGSATAAGNDPRIINPIPSDATTFLAQIDQAIAAIPSDSPIILLGHSWGGNSMLKVAKLNDDRDIAFLGLYDPVGDGGWRSNVINDNTGGIVGVPDNVDYFFNRWEQNSVFFNGVPFDSSSQSGVFTPSRALISDQARQDESRDTAGNAIGGQLRHSLVPYDDYIEAQTIEAIINHVAFPPVADAGADQIATTGDVVSLTGTASDANPGDSIAYSWQLVSYQSYPGGPVESMTNPLSNPNAASPTFVPTVGGVWTFDLTVSDSTQRYDTDRVVITSNLPPELNFIELLDEKARLHASSVATDSSLVFAWGTITGTTYYPQHDVSLGIQNATFSAPLTVGSEGTASCDIPISFTRNGQAYYFQAFEVSHSTRVTDVVQVNIAGSPLIVSESQSIWQNLSDPHDVNQDGDVTPIDALFVINCLNESQDNSLPNHFIEGEVLVDVNGDWKLTPLDALQVINWLNRAIPLAMSNPIPASEPDDNDDELRVAGLPALDGRFLSFG